MNTSPFARACLFLFIALVPIQDFFLRGTPLRNLGGSPSVFPLLGLVALAFARWLASGDLRVNRVFLLCLVYVFATTIYGFFFFGLRSHGESLFWKSTTAFVVLSLGICAVTIVDYRFTSTVRAGVYAAFCLLVVGYCFGNANPFGLPPWVENPLLHATPISDLGRPRGLTPEPSEFSITVITLGLLTTYVTESKVGKGVLLGVTVALLIASGSKGGILTLFLCLILLCIVKWHSRWYHVPGVVFVLLPLGLSLIWVLSVLFPNAVVYETTTVPTRLSMLLCALYTVRHHPLGVGLSGFLPAVGTYLPGAMDTLQSFFPLRLDFSEVVEHLTSSAMVSTGTFFFDQLMRFGVPFALGFLVFVVTLLKRLTATNQWILAIALLAAALAATTYVGAFGDYAIPLVFGIAFSKVRNWTESLS
jgi:hypothetical protein